MTAALRPPRAHPRSHAVPAPAGGAHLVLHERAARYVAAPAAERLSIKTMWDGHARYDVAGVPRRVSPERYLVVEAGCGYRVTIDALRPVESLCVFFAPGFVEEVRRARVAAPGRLLDDPAPASQAPALSFLGGSRPTDDAVGTAMGALRGALLGGESARSWLEGRLHDLAAALLAAEYADLRRALACPLGRAATRLESVRRVGLGRDYLEATYDEHVLVADAARAAAMSPHHFHRAFRRVFGCTPHAYLTACRLRRARQLLRATELSVSAVACAVGFDSLASFSTLFRREHGVPPSQYRRHARAPGRGQAGRGPAPSTGARATAG